MDGFLHSQADMSGEAGGSNMAPAEQSPREPRGATLEGIGEEIRSMAAAMATKADLLVHTTFIQDALRAEIAGIRSEVTAHTGRIQSLEHSQETQATRLQGGDHSRKEHPGGEEEDRHRDQRNEGATTRRHQNKRSCRRPRRARLPDPRPHLGDLHLP
ncbi:Hypothetical predicted protein [Pelobates cultripes]|uniref:Uncharacterized protein n=1 Tax=Pelobates cultripes TaxID=61616 RepID=A0AAD1VYL7_PELCU|nr:Hypothetical predicted protein [Pelobates cultripes]